MSDKAERIMQGGVDCGPKDENMSRIGKMADKIDGYLADLRGLVSSNRDAVATIASIAHKVASIRHMTDYEGRCTACTLAALMLEGLEIRNKCIKGLRGEVALLEKTKMEQGNELGTRYGRIKELEGQLKQRSET